MKGIIKEAMRVMLLHPSAQHTWPQLSVCLSCVLSASSIYAQLAPVRFNNNQEKDKDFSNFSPAYINYIKYWV
jgi:hypothetical protein